MKSHLQRAVDCQPWSPRGWLVESSQHARLHHARQIATKMCGRNETCDITIRVRLQCWPVQRSHSKKAPLRNHYLLKTMLFQHFVKIAEFLSKILNISPTRSLATDFSQTSRLAWMKLHIHSPCTTTFMAISGKSKKISPFLWQTFINKLSSMTLGCTCLR